MGIAATDGAPKCLKSAFRDEMSVSQSWAYFDHAAVSPIPRRSAEAMQRWLVQASQDGDVPWPEWSSRASKLRDAASRMLHCKTEEVALVPNTTYGINAVALGLPWRQGDSVVVLENEFPSNLLPWLSLERFGVEVRCIPVDGSGLVDLASIRDAIDQSTRLVAISWVGYATGYRVDLSELCDMVHQAGAQLFVDAIQGLGVFPLNTRDIPIDYAAADGHKWMLGPEGAGLLYIRESNLDRLAPIMVGWNAIKASHEFRSQGAVLKDDASRFEGGSANHVGLIGLGASLELLLELGCHQPDGFVARRVLENASRLRDAIQRAGGELAYHVPKTWDDATASGIVSFSMPNRDPVAVRKHLIDAGVVLSVRHGKLRVATHAYNNEQDIERLASALARP
jgi:cysteine desulfurase / selenocysteine lyase